MKKKNAKKLQDIVYKISIAFELVMAFAVIIALLIKLVNIPEAFVNLYYTSNFNEFLQIVFNMIIGIELLKMLCRHDLDSVVEVLLFAVARAIVIEHMSVIETFVGIMAIALLFFIRKYLFIPALDKSDEENE